jgi:transposase-like protein
MDQKYHRYKRYDDDFKRNALDLLESSGRPMAEIAWRHQMRGRNRKPPTSKDGPPPDPLALENAQLRRKLADVEMERDILKKALAICSREANSRGGSN